MPVQVSKSPFAAALKAHANAPVEVPQDFTNLPGGITNGTARLVEAKIDKYKKGKNQGQPYLYLAAVVQTPQKAVKTEKMWQANGQGGEVVIVGRPTEMTVAGLRTSQTLPLCQTGEGDNVTSLDDNVRAALNMVQLVGGEGCTAFLANSKDPDGDFLKLLQGLKQAKPLIKFSTRSSDPTQQYPTPRVWETWYGAVPPDGSGEASDGAVDDSTGGGDSGGESQAPDAAGDGPDVEALVQAADGGDEEAQQQLIALAVEAGHSQEDAENAADWAAVGEMVANPPSGDSGDAPPFAEGELYHYQVIDPKTKKPLLDPKTKKPRKPVEVEVKAVDADNQTVDLLNNVDKKTVYKAVPWDKVIVPQ